MSSIGAKIKNTPKTFSFKETVIRFNEKIVSTKSEINWKKITNINEIRSNSDCLFLNKFTETILNHEKVIFRHYFRV